MKKSILIISLFIASSFSFSQNCFKPNTLNYLIAGGGEHFGGYNFEFYGEETQSFLDSLLLKYPDSKRKNFTWKIKNATIEGIDGELSLEICLGLNGNNGNGHGYFYTFQSNQHKELLLSRKKDSEMLGILIYVKKGRKYALKSEEMARIVKEYLLVNKA